MCPHSVATGLTQGSARQDLQWKDRGFGFAVVGLLAWSLWLLPSPSSVVVAVVGVAAPLLDNGALLFPY